MKLAQVFIIIFIFVSLSFARAKESSIKELVPQQVELLNIASTSRAIESWFGHTSLLMIPQGRTWKDGFVISLNANISGRSTQEFKYLVDGATGEFPFIVVAVRASRFFYTKLVEEGRDIQRTIIPLTQKQKIDLWKATLELSEHPQEMGRYYYLRKNCSSMILYLFKKAGLQINYEQIMSRSKLSGVSPGQMRMLLSDVLITPFPSVYMKSIRTRVLDLSAKYGIVLGSDYSKEKNKFAPWDSEQIRLLQSMATPELLVAAQSVSFFDVARIQVIQSEIKKRGQIFQTDFIEFKNFPASYYTACEDVQCTQSVIGDLKKTYSTRALQLLYVGLKQTYDRTNQLFIPELNLKTSPQALHWMALFQNLGETLILPSVSK